MLGGEFGTQVAGILEENRCSTQSGGFSLIINKTIRRLQSAPAHNRTELVATISLLGDLLDHAAAGPDTPDIETMRSIAELALTAAIESERKQNECERQIADLERLALTDALTGVLNRRGIEQVIASALSAARRYDEQGVLALIDLDGFKLVNDTYGHVVGDIVLKQVSRVLLENVRKTDHVGRIGGDEFVVLLTRVPWEDGLKRARLLDEQLNGTAVNIDGWTIMLRASVGMQIYGGEDNSETLLSLADSAMYKAKEVRSDRSAKASNA